MSSTPEHGSRGLAGQLFRFGVTGGLATLTHILIYASLYPYLLIAAWHANVAAFLVAVGVSYYGNSHWVFPGNSGDTSQVLKFSVSAIIGLLLNTFFAWYVVDYLHNSQYLSMLLMVGVTPLVVFVINKYFVFTQ